MMRTSNLQAEKEDRAEDVRAFESRAEREPEDFWGESSAAPNNEPELDLPHVEPDDSVHALNHRSLDIPTDTGISSLRYILVQSLCLPCSQSKYKRFHDTLDDH